MELNTLIEQCKAQIACGGEMISLLFSGQPHGDTEKFHGVSGVIAGRYDDEYLCAFDAQELLDALEKK